MPVRVPPLGGMPIVGLTVAACPEEGPSYLEGVPVAEMGKDPQGQVRTASRPPQS